jgi:hypothetical protein
VTFAALSHYNFGFDAKGTSLRGRFSHLLRGNSPSLDTTRSGKRDLDSLPLALIPVFVPSGLPLLKEGGTRVCSTCLEPPGPLVLSAQKSNNNCEQRKG